MAKRKDTTPKPIPPRVDQLDAATKLALTAEAKASVVAEMEQDARDAYFKTELERIRRAEIPDEALVFVMIDAAPYIPYVMLDGTQYFHGYTYEVAHSVRMVLLEQMQRSWLHQDEIDGRSRFNPYRRPQNQTIGLHDMGTPTVGVNGPVQAEV